MPQYNADNSFYRITLALLPLWGPFYAFYYLVRFIVKQIFKR